MENPTISIAAVTMPASTVNATRLFSLNQDFHFAFPATSQYTPSAHSVRGFISGTLRKKLCLTIKRKTHNEGDATYQIHQMARA